MSIGEEQEDEQLVEMVMMVSVVMVSKHLVVVDAELDLCLVCELVRRQHLGMHL